jgi:hypothetical protein
LIKAKVIDIIGRWSLISYSTENLDGQSITITERQIGSLEYTVDGKVELAIDRDPEMLAELRVDPSAAKIFYSGHFEVDDESQQVKHFVEISNIQDRVGTVLNRTFELKNGRLIVRGQGLRASVILEWARTKQQKGHGPL